jgi:hypothetical protein
VTIDGKEMKAVVDTGASTSYITMRAPSAIWESIRKTGAEIAGQHSGQWHDGPVYNYPFQT